MQTLGSAVIIIQLILWQYADMLGRTCPLSTGANQEEVCSQTRCLMCVMHAKLDGKTWLFILEMLY